ncbi:MAG: HAD family hydrolase [Planctomycetes bacterium]|nr:HAD family hydrolase [Planctomycetota bacterium]
MPLTTLLLDAGGTLVFPNCRRIADEFARDGVAVEPERLAAAEERIRFELDRPEVVAASNDSQRWNRYLGEMCRRLDIGQLPEAAFGRLKAYHDRENLWEMVPAEVPGALDRLRRRLRLGVVSNANGTVRHKLARLGLAERFEVIVDSHEEGVEKPDPRLFRIALARMGVAAEEAAYVGDLYCVDVVGARAAGLSPILLDPRDWYADRPCRRVRSLTELADAAEAGSLHRA